MYRPSSSRHLRFDSSSIVPFIIVRQRTLLIICGVADFLSTFRMTQQDGQEESDQQEDRDGWFVNWNRSGGVQ
jgi:hypothetical protein